MTWEETIEHIRKEKSYENLVESAYFSPNLKSNVERYIQTEEFKATLEEIKMLNNAKNLSILDLGAGNGISTIAFALQGYNVTALEPDPSETIGAGAIKILAKNYNLNNVNVLECYAEDIPEDKINSFDIVFARQAMHHAYHLENFVAAAYRVLKPKGVFMTIRDHVVETPKEKEIFLERHPLHKFYGGENAFSLAEYKGAMLKAGFHVLKIYNPSSTPINYHPWNKELVKQKISLFGKSNFLTNLVWTYLSKRWDKMPGRLYTFIAQKP